MKHPQSPLASLCSAHPLKGASPLAGETPATAIAGLACSAAIGFFESQVSQMARAPIHL